MTAADPLGIGRYLLDDVPARWCTSAVRALAEGRAVPEYGSEAWRQAEHRLQVAGALVAAEAYRREVLFLAQTLEDEQARYRWLTETLEAADFAVVASRVRDLARQPSHAELVARRAA